MLTVYIVLALALIAQPHVLEGHAGPLSSAQGQSLVTTVILATAMLTYVLHRAALRHAERRSAALQEEKARANEKLLDSFRYIGTMNRRLPLLQEVTTDLLRETTPTEKGRRSAFRKILELAVVTTARASWGHLRFIDRATGRTIAESMLDRGGTTAPRAPIGNRDLLEIERRGQGAAVSVPSVCWSADADAPYQTFLVLGEMPAEGQDPPTLQSLVDQAHVLLPYLSYPPASRVTDKRGLASRDRSRSTTGTAVTP